MPLQDLLDIAFEMPPLLQKWEAAKADSAEPWSTFRTSMATIDIAKLLGDMLEINDKFQRWYDDFTSPSHEYMPINERPSIWDNTTLDTEEGAAGKVYRNSYTYTHFPIAMASIYFDGIRIQLLKNVDELCAELAARTEASQESMLETRDTSFARAVALLRGPTVLISVERILRSAEYFFDSDKKLVGPTTLMFAFHVAFGALCRLSRGSPKGTYRRELRWCHMISNKYEEVRLASLASLDLGKPINAFFEMLTS